ncbi:MAG: P44/Msp2 family outer membrane protein [Anaplasma sp.]
MSACKRTCSGVFACGALAMLLGASSSWAAVGADGLYAALGGGMSVANFRGPSLNNRGLSAVASGVIKTRDGPVWFSDFRPRQRIPEAFDAPYAPKYKRSGGFSGALGYKLGPSRIQLGVFSGRFEIDGSGYAWGGNASYFAFVSEAHPSEDGAAALPLSHIGQISEIGVGAIELSACRSGLTIGLGTRSSLGVYSCLGVGAVAVDYWGSGGGLEWSWGGKVGVEYVFNPALSLFAEAYYTGVDAAEYDRGLFMPSARYVTRRVGLPDLTAALGVGYFGGLGGVRYTFNSR